MSDKREVKPMDDGIREEAVGVASANNKRVCYAIRTLVREVLDLFPETTVEYSNYDGRNTALDVTFDLSEMNSDDAEVLANLLELLGDSAYNEDRRINSVIETDRSVQVSMHANPRTQDVRDPFGLADAYEVLASEDSDDGLPAVLHRWDGEGSR